jgi:flagellar motor switch protein FliM
VHTSSHSDAADSRMNSRGKRVPTVHSPGDAPTVSPFDPRRSGQLTPSQSLAIEALHKSCAVRLSDSFSSQLRSSVEVTLGSIEQVTGAELLDRVPAPSYLLFVRTSYNATALLQMDLALAFPFLDILLGGSGAESPEPRELTEIELGILEPLARSAARSLQENWQSLLNVSFEVDSPATKSGLNARLPVGERLLLVGFQLRFQKFEGRMLVVFPAQIVAALRRKLEPQESPALPEPSLDRGKVQERLLEGAFTAELLLPPSTVSFRQLNNLRIGDVLLLQVPATTPLEVRVAGQPRFLAAPVRSGNKRGAQIHKILAISAAEEK